MGKIAFAIVALGWAASAAAGVGLGRLTASSPVLATVVAAAAPFPDFTVVSVVSYTGTGEKQGMYATVLVDGKAYEHYVAGLGGPSACVRDLRVGSLLPESCR